MAIDQSKLERSLKTVFDEFMKDKMATMFDLKLEPILKSLDFMSKGYDVMIKKIEVLEKTNKSLIEENKLLKMQITHITDTVNQAKNDLVEQEQYIRRKCLEIRGIPVTPYENTN